MLVRPLKPRGFIIYYCQRVQARVSSRKLRPKPHKTTSERDEHSIELKFTDHCGFTYIQELELNPELVLNKHFRFPNEPFTGTLDAIIWVRLKIIQLKSSSIFFGLGAGSGVGTPSLSIINCEHK